MDLKDSGSSAVGDSGPWWGLPGLVGDRPDKKQFLKLVWKEGDKDLNVPHPDVGYRARHWSQADG